MDLTYFNVGYSKNNIKILNKKKKFNLIINKCNDYCNNVNPIFCFNCLYLIESNPILNSKFSNYILVDKKTNKFYEVLRHSLKNDLMRMNYCNNNCTNSIYNNHNSYNYDQQFYNQQFYNQQCYDQQCYNQQCYNQQCYNEQSYNEQSYDQECYNEQCYDQQCYNQQRYDQECYNEQCYDQEYNNFEEESNYNFDNETNYSKTISEITLDKTVEINDENSHDLVCNDFSEDEASEDSNCKKDILEDIVLKEQVSEDEVLENQVSEDKVLENKVSEDKVSNEQVLEEEISEDQVREEIFEDPIFENLMNEIENCKKKVKKLSKKEKNKLKNERRKQRKRKEEEKKREEEEEEKKLFENEYELNRLDMIDKLSKLDIENYEIIKNLSYEQLKKKIDHPIIYDIKRKLYKLYGRKKGDINLDMNIYKDFKDFDLSKQYIVDRVKTYLNKSEFNRFYFNCIYEYIYFNKLNILIIDKNEKMYDWQFYNKKHENDLKFYEQIFDNEINEYLRDYIVEIIIKPFIEKKKDELKDKYDNYEEKLLKRNKVSYEESLLIIYKKMIEIDGKLHFGRKGWLVFDENNDVKKIYYY